MAVHHRRAIGPVNRGRKSAGVIPHREIVVYHVVGAGVGKQFGDGRVHIHEKQPLVFVSKPGGTAKEVVELSRRIMDLVREETGIAIETEVEWVN